MRLIDANEVLCFIKDEIEQSKEEKNEARARDCENDAAYNSGEIQEARRIERHILNAPIIDAVPVVRCEHCKEAVECRLYGEHWGLPPEKGIFCKVWQKVVDKNGYCYQGAKKDRGAK